MTKDVTFSRRRLLQGGAVIAGLASAPALAKGPMLGGQAPYFYRFKLGNAEATIVSDGPLPLGDPHKNYLGLTPEETDKQLTENFFPTDDTVLEQNVLVLNTGDRMVLFDTGMGSRRADDHTQAGRHRSEGYRRRGDEPCAHRSLRWLHGRRWLA